MTAERESGVALHGLITVSRIAMDSAEVPAVPAGSFGDAPIGDAILPSFDLYPVLYARRRRKGVGQSEGIIVHRDSAKRAGWTLAGIASGLICDEWVKDIGLCARRDGGINSDGEIENGSAGAEVDGIVSAAPLNVGDGGGGRDGEVIPDVLIVGIAVGIPPGRGEQAAVGVGRLTVDNSRG